MDKNINSFGKNIRLTTEGGSHDEFITAKISGFPAGVRIDREKLLKFMARRAPGNSAFATARKESDEPIFLSGVDGNFLTNGDEMTIRIYSKNAKSSAYKDVHDIPRPSHADYPAIVKYGRDVDLRGGGHFSGRLTALLCAFGGVCMQYLEEKGISVFSHIYSVYDIKDKEFSLTEVGENEKNMLSSSLFPVLDNEAGERMQEKIAEAKSRGDSVGGVIECAVTGLPVGLGEHMFASVEARITEMLFSVPALKGVEFGRGFDSCKLYGSENNDPYVTDGKRVWTKTNNCGGILGGMTNGMPIVFRVAMKPTPSIASEQDSISLSKMENTKLSIVGRHDPCIVPRAAAAVEAASAIAVLDLVLDSKNENSAPANENKQGGDRVESSRLSELRGVIDRCDRTIVATLAERMAAASGVAEYKIQNNLPVLDASREAQLLEKIRMLAGEEYAEYFAEIYAAVLKTSKEYQQKMIDGSRSEEK